MRKAKGRFVWFDLMTTDVNAARQFYGSIIGWTTTAWAGGGYDIWKAGEDEIGGVFELPAEARSQGATPHWYGYAAVDDTDATAKKAQQLGGKVILPPKDIPNMGRFAILTDPQGALFAVFSSDREEPAPSVTGLGHTGWCELNTSDWKAAWSFYAGLLGWEKSEAMDMGPELGVYQMFSPAPGEEMMGGMSDTAAMMQAPPHWLYYFNVRDVDSLVKHIEELGGTIVAPPMEVPGGSRVAQCRDPQGALFAVVSSKGM